MSLKDSHLAGHEYEKWDFMRRELLETGVQCSDQAVQQLVAVWQAVFRRVYAYYDLAAEAYFRYLGLGGDAQVCVYTVAGYCTVLYCTVKYCTVLYCTVL